MMRIDRAILAASTILAACSPAIRSDRDETIAVPHGATWAWGARDSTSRFERDPRLNDPILNQRFHRSIEAVMEARGFRKVDDAGAADFLLTYHMGVDRGRPGLRGSMAVGVGIGFGGRGGRYRPWGYGPYDRWGWGWYGPPMWGAGMVVYPGPYPVAYRDGSLLVLLRARESGDVAWTAQYDMDVYDRVNVTQKQVDKIVGRMFDSLR